MTKKTMSRGTAMFWIFIAGFFWSIGGLMVKISKDNPITLLGYRALLSLPVLFMFTPPGKLKINKRVFLYALFPTALAFTYVFSARLTTAANAIMLQYASPLYVVILCYILYKKKPGKEDIAVVIASMAGMILFFMDDYSPGNMLGNLIALLGGLLFACYYTLTGASGEDSSSIIIMSQLQLVILAAPFMFGVAPLTMERNSIIAALGMGVIQRGLGEGIYGKTAPHCSPLDAVLMSMTEPLLNPVWVMVFYGERPEKFALIGSVVIVLSVVLWNIYKSKTASKGQNEI